MHKIEKELKEAASFKSKKGEKRQAELERLRKAVGDLTDKEWEDLSSGAQEWANAANGANDEDRELPEPGAEVDASAKDSDADEAKAEKPAKGGKASKGAAKAKGDDGEEEEKPSKAAKSDKGKKAPAKRGNGIVEAIFAHTLKNPEDDGEAIVKALKADGIKASPATASSCSAFFKKTVRFLQSKKLTTKTLFE